MAQQVNKNAIWVSIVMALAAPKLANYGIKLSYDQFAALISAVFVGFHFLDPYIQAWLKKETQLPSK